MYQPATTERESIINRSKALVGKRFVTLYEDHEEDETYGIVTHPVGSVFKVDSITEWDWQMLIVAWESAINEVGESVPAEGMWTIWSCEEILKDAREIE